jgi:hypothetical protein
MEEQDNLKMYKSMSEEKARSLPEARFNEWKMYGRKTPRFYTKSRKKFAEAVSKEGHTFYKAFLARWGKLMDSNNCRAQFHEVWQQLEDKHGLEKNLLKRRYNKRKRSGDDSASDDDSDDVNRAVQVTPISVVLEGEEGYEDYVKARDADYASDCDLD